jgi:nickel-dependent lactate racemase
MATISLPFGRASIPCPLPQGAVVEVLRPQERLPLDPVGGFIEAVEHPIGGPPLSRLARAGGPVVIVVPDKSRRFPTAEILPPLLAYLARLGPGPAEIVVAYGLHRPHPLREIGLDPFLAAGAPVLNHGVGRARPLATIGTTPLFRRAGRKPIRISALAARARFVVVLGSIAPHPMAGFSGGAKAIVPGVAGAGTIALNHALMFHPRSRWGVSDGNPLRDDLETAVRLLPRVFCLNAVYDAGGRVAGIVAGDPVEAHRAGVAIARSIGEVPARRADFVIAGAGAPETLTAFQALRLVVPASMIVKPGGTIVIAAECSEGSGEMKPVSRLIYDVMMRRNIPAGVKVYLYSSFRGNLRLPRSVRRVAGLDEVISAGWPRPDRQARLAILSGADLLIPRPAGG